MEAQDGDVAYYVTCKLGTACWAHREGMEHLHLSTVERADGSIVESEDGDGESDTRGA